MRSSVLLWSAFSGLLLGLFLGIALFAVVVIGGELVPTALPRVTGRARLVALVITTVALPAAGAVLGFLEGRLKLQ